MPKASTPKQSYVKGEQRLKPSPPRKINGGLAKREVTKPKPRLPRVRKHGPDSSHYHG